jgi:hypothetical protein
MLESVGKFKEAEAHKKHLGNIMQLKQSLIELITMDIEKPMEKMRGQAKIFG